MDMLRLAYRLLQGTRASPNYSCPMFRNYITTAFRALVRDKGFSLINVLGFSIGIACTVLILFWVQDELSYDRSHEKKERIHRVLARIPTGDGNMEAAVTPAALAPMLEDEFPEIQKATRFKGMGSYTFVKGDKRFQERYCGLAESKLFSIFTFSFIEGDPKTCLDGPNSIVLTQSLAEKYFDRESPMGQEIEILGVGVFKVTGVIEDVTHSHFPINYLIPIEWAEFFYDDTIDELGAFNYTTYILTGEEVSPTNLENKIEHFLDHHADENRRDHEVYSRLFLQELNDIYLRSDFSYDFTIRGDIQHVYTFSAIALIILLIASINFMNLTTARSANRAREIGVRKVQGAHRKHLISQFYVESAMITFFSFVIALVLVELVLPYFNNLAGKGLSQSLLTQPILGVAYLVLALITSVLAGSYPALYLSSFQPVKVLKGKLSSGSKSGGLRKALVIVQFSISIALIVSTFVVSDQLQYIQNKKLGYNKEHLVGLHQRGEISKKYKLFKERLLASPDITHVSAISNPLIYAGPSLPVDQWEGNNGERSIRMHFHSVDYDIIETLGVEMLKGRSLTRDFHDDSSTVFLVNQRAVEKMGLEDPLGKMITLGNEQGRIVGVFKDFNYNTIHHQINPQTLKLATDETRGIYFRVVPGRDQKALAYAEKVWNNMEPDQPFSYEFVDQQLDELYRAEQRIGTLFRYFTFFAIFISCLGLLGLASFMTQQRQKEIGVRKVMGSRVGQLVMLLTRDFTKWVLLAGVIGLPVGYYAMSRWLQGFHYRTDISLVSFFVALFTAVLIAVLTVGIQTYRASVRNPVDTLRDE